MAKAKPARLYLTSERRDANGWRKQNATYLIRNGKTRIMAGCGSDHRNRPRKEP